MNPSTPDPGISESLVSEPHLLKAIEDVQEGNISPVVQADVLYQFNLNNGRQLTVDLLSIGVSLHNALIVTERYIDGCNINALTYRNALIEHALPV